MIYGPFTFAFGILTFDKLRSNSFQTERKWISIENFNECTRKKTRIARILEMIWIMLLVIDWKSRFGIAPPANVGLYFKEFLIYSGCRWLRLNWFPAIDLHLAQIILSYSIELANKLKQIGYLSFRQNFPQMKIQPVQYTAMHGVRWTQFDAKMFRLCSVGHLGFEQHPDTHRT